MPFGHLKNSFGQLVSIFGQNREIFGQLSRNFGQNQQNFGQLQIQCMHVSSFNHSPLHIITNNQKCYKASSSLTKIPTPYKKDMHPPLHKCGVCISFSFTLSIIPCPFPHAQQLRYALRTHRIALVLVLRP
ncbi:hypothetical protein EKQ44_19205 [Sutcliffiella horikoshii]|nr:hypothetical protein [Sutcliffiella horikoshii]